jgi:ribonuclease HI
MKDPSKTKAKPYSYLSLVGQVAQRHSSWTECEARVKGQSGAKFKKAMSQLEEAQILESWGISPAKLKS